ncbi:MAG: hypothetical protein U0R72_02280 [Nakamurella multipartita]
MTGSELKAVATNSKYPGTDGLFAIKGRGAPIGAAGAGGRLRRRRIGSGHRGQHPLRMQLAQLRDPGQILQFGQLLTELRDLELNWPRVSACAPATSARSLRTAVNAPAIAVGIRSGSSTKTATSRMMPI